MRVNSQHPDSNATFARRCSRTAIFVLVLGLPVLVWHSLDWTDEAIESREYYSHDASLTGPTRVRYEPLPNQSSDKVGISQLSLVSCASCHGDHGYVNTDDPSEIWRSAYPIWASRDPHAEAYLTLWNHQSRQIVAALDRQNTAANSSVRSPVSDAARYQGLLRKHCVSCHSSVPLQFTVDSPSARVQAVGEMLLSSGVSCHSCHTNGELDSGDDQSWVRDHTLQSWTTLSETDKSSQGLSNLNQHAVRAQTCLKCHLGSAGRDVNHDLIAAGHPRLVFEYSSYLARLPKHWSEPSAEEDDFHTRCWAVGQIESTRAALELLKQRALAAEQLQSQIESNSEQAMSQWPELTEYNCHNCHHGLSAEWYLANEPLQSGKWQWGTWAFPRHVGMSDWQESITELQSEMENFPPDPSRVLQALEQIPSLDHSQPARQWLYEVLRAEPRLNSDEVFAWYLAANSALLDFPPHQSDQRRAAIVQMTELKQMLDRPFQNDVEAESKRITADEMLATIRRLQQIIVPVLKNELVSTAPADSVVPGSAP